MALVALAAASSCSHNPNKAEKIDTSIKNSDVVSGDTSVGVKDGNMIVQRKALMSEDLRRLQYETYELEDRVYGNRRYGSLGLYGVLKGCREQLSDPKNGGDGKLKWTEPMDRVTDKEEDLKLGIDEKDKIVAVSEELLNDRIQRFRGYKKLLMQRQDEYEDKISICNSEIKGQKAKAGKTE